MQYEKYHNAANPKPKRYGLDLSNSLIFQAEDKPWNATVTILGNARLLGRYHLSLRLTVPNPANWLVRTSSVRRKVGLPAPAYLDIEVLDVDGFLPTTLAVLDVKNFLAVTSTLRNAKESIGPHEPLELIVTSPSNLRFFDFKPTLYCDSTSAITIVQK